MKIPSTPPIAPPGATRASRAYGIAPKPAAAPAAAVKADGGNALRSILTDDERAYFDQLAALGPLSYGPGRANAGLAAPRGLRLDVTG